MNQASINVSFRDLITRTPIIPIRSNTDADREAVKQYLSKLRAMSPLLSEYANQLLDPFIKTEGEDRLDWNEVSCVKLTPDNFALIGDLEKVICLAYNG